MRGIGVIGGMHAWALLRAAGRVVPIDEDVADIEGALAYIEPEYGARVLNPVQLALDGRLDDFSTVVLDRDNRIAYLYLTELHRRGVLPRLAPLYLFDFVADESSASRAHNEREVRALHRHLQRVFHDPLPAERIRQQLDDEVRLSAALSALQDRRAAGTASGVEAKSLLASRRRRSIDDVIASAAALPVAESNGALPVLLVPQDSTPGTVAHELIRDARGEVIEEEDWYGSRSIGSAEGTCSADPLVDVIERLMGAPGTDEVSPPSALLRWYSARLAAGRIGLVVALTSPTDQRRGWEIPHRRRIAAEIGVPFLWLHEDLADSAGAVRARERLHTFIADLQSGAMS